MNSVGFDTRAYWEERLRNNNGLKGVGFTMLGQSYNEWLYKVRRVVFHRVARSLDLDWAKTSVLDIGSGMGFYIEQWRERSASCVEGMDLTEAAVSRLAEKFPDINFHRFDIGDPIPECWSGKYDVISAFDVLFHIVDDSRYEKAIQNVHALLAPGGWFLFSDLFLHGEVQRWEHMVSRPLETVVPLLKRTGFRIVHRQPIFVLMNMPVDSDSHLSMVLWKLLTYPARLSDFFGYLIGACLYPLELLLTGHSKEGPSTEMMICQKRELEPSAFLSRSNDL